MAWDLEIIYSGLCLFYLPDELDVDSDDITKRPQVLLVDTANHHEHAPLLAFDPRDLDDLSVDLGTLLPSYGFSSNRRADHEAQVSIEKTEIRLKLASSDEAQHGFEVPSGRRSSSKPTSLQQERLLDWVAPIKATHPKIAGIDPNCLNGKLGHHNLCPVTARMPFTHGDLGSHRLGRIPNDYSIWEFYPNYQDDSAIVQALADQVSLRFRGLTDYVTLYLKREHGEQYLKFPSRLDRSKVRLGISNLPATPETPASELLTHFSAYFGLVKWKQGSAPKHLPVPRPWTPNGFLGSNGGGTLCPCAECD